jgi:hypothetical protein
MNALIKKIFAIGSILLLSACAHYSGAYYPNSASYGRGYTVVERDYYRSAPNYGYYSPGGDHSHDVYQPRWQADYGRPSHDHYHPPHDDSRHWAQPQWQHEDHRPYREDHRISGHTEQPRFRDDNHQKHWPSLEHTAPGGGRFNPGQFGGVRDNNRWQHENRGPRHEERSPDHAGQQRHGDGERQQHWKRENGRSHQHGRYE